jgi:hypothetical protein
MKQFNLLLANPFVLAYDNTIDPFIPEIWANESLAILEENMVAASLIHRDFEPEFAKYGDIVHTRRPGEFTAKRKTPSDDVTVQDATATDVQVPLNQHIHVSFLIKDGEESKSFKDLIETYMAPAMLAQARAIDRLVLGQYVHFMQYGYGNLGGLTANNGRAQILGTRNVMNQNKAYMDGRNLILTPASETTLLNLDLFTQAQQVGDDGTALSEAWLGRKLGFNMYMCQNMAYVNAGNTVVTGTINHSGGYSVGDTALTVTGFSAAISNGTWFTVAGDDTPLQVASTTGSGTPTVITAVAPGLTKAVSNGAVVTVYTPGAVNNSSGYALNYGKEITVSGFTIAPQIGQFVTFNTSTKIYTIVDVTSTTGITLDRPLEAAIANSDKVNIGPAGSYNLAFHRNAMTLVVRPLAMPRAGVGALSAVVNHNDLSMRATITYNGLSQGHLVTLDFLCGIAILDQHLGAVMYG